jgi:hypothetical protein
MTIWICATCGVGKIAELGGAAVIVASHPHMYGSQVSWSHLLGNIPVLVHSADRHWVQREDPVIREWNGTEQVLPGITPTRSSASTACWAARSWPTPRTPCAGPPSATSPGSAERTTTSAESLSGERGTRTKKTGEIHPLPSPFNI